MKVYTNYHLLEVVCAFNFIESDTKWDSSFFGQFYDKIKDRGFTQKEERRGIQIQFPAAPMEPGQTFPPVREVDSTMIFRNEEAGLAITMGKEAISFHSVGKYAGWDHFCIEVIKPLIDIYNKLEIYKEIAFCQVIYLNRFTFDESVNLTEYFTMLTEVNPGFGLAMAAYIQKQYLTENVSLIVKFNSSYKEDKSQEVNIECGAISTNNPSVKGMDLIELAQMVRLPLRDFFESHITDKLRNEKLYENTL